MAERKELRQRETYATVDCLTLVLAAQMWTRYMECTRARGWMCDGIDLRCGRTLPCTFSKRCKVFIHFSCICSQPAFWLECMRVREDGRIEVG